MYSRPRLGNWYVIWCFAPWLNGVTNCIVGGRFSPEQWYKMIQDFKVTVWYTAPTALRMLMSAGDDVVDKYDLSSLRSILSVGEPLNPEVIKWSKDVFHKRVLDTWWMTETGGHMIVNYPAMDIKLVQWVNHYQVLKQQLLMMKVMSYLQIVWVT